MQHIADTILGEAEQLAQLHDFLYFKAQAYEQEYPQLSNSLAECVTLIANASNIIIADVKYELERHYAPMVSKVKKVPVPQGNPVDCLEQALKLFPKESVPAIEIILGKTPERILSIHTRIVQYMQDKRMDIEVLSRQKDTIELYIAELMQADI